MSITFDPRRWVYVSSAGNTYGTLEEAQAAEKSPSANPLAGYDANTNTFHATDPVVSHRVQTQSPSGQVFSAPETVMTDILPDFGNAPSLAALSSSSRSSMQNQGMPAQPAFRGQPAYTGTQAYTGQPTPAPFDPLARLDDVMTKVKSNLPSPSGGMTPDESAARAAAFARAKDQTANIARASLNALRSAYAGRGLNVAGGENRFLQSREADVADNAEGTLGEVTREQLIQDLKRAKEIGDRSYAASTGYNSQISGLAQSIMSMMQANARAY